MHQEEHEETSQSGTLLYCSTQSLNLIYFFLSKWLCGATLRPSLWGSLCDVCVIIGNTDHRHLEPRNILRNVIVDDPLESSRRQTKISDVREGCSVHHIISLQGSPERKRPLSQGQMRTPEHDTGATEACGKSQAAAVPETFAALTQSPDKGT